jgi:hypothetical protein
MKQILLFLALSTAISINAQLTQSNEPSIGNSITMYVCDSNATNMSSITGSGVTWDYSTIGAYPSKFKTIEIVDPSTTSQASTFTTSTKSTKIQNFITSYWTSTANSRTSQGFVFTEPTMGNIIANFSIDNETTMTYPFDYNSSITDNFSGNLSFTLGIAQSPACSGSSASTIDGKGTLILSPTVTKTNVIRYKIADHTQSTISFGGNHSVDLYRTQYEYYEQNNNLPIFTHTNVTMLIPDYNININNSLVLSSVQPSGFVGINSTDLVDFTIYPNPTYEKITLSGVFNADSKIKILDQFGRTVFDSISLTNGMEINVTNFKKGIYFVEIENNGLKTKKSLVII